MKFMREARLIVKPEFTAYVLLENPNYNTQGRTVVLCELVWINGKKEYATFICTHDNELFSGRYFESYKVALKDFNKRVIDVI